jgi:hypothetical protein
MSHLTPRDLQLADWLDQHGVLTTTQIATALFHDRGTANHRLLKLLHLGLLDRFRQPLPGGGVTAWHWVLGPLGAQVTAAARGEAPPSPQQLYQRQLRLAASPALGHRLGTNSFFIDLYAHARRHPGARLLRWWSERDTARRYVGRIHPDGHGLWSHSGRVSGFFLEHDTGTENHNRLVRKLEAYWQLAVDGGPRYPVLYWLHSARREANLQAALAERGIPVVAATAVRGPGVTPAGAVWLLAGGRRVALHQLPGNHGDPDGMFTPNLNDPELDQLL